MMDYFRIYNSLIDKFKVSPQKGFYEKHHIIPRCMGGDNSELNLVKLSPKAHYLAHYLLYKMYGTKELAFAWHCMSKTREGLNITSREYEDSKKFWAKEMSKINKGSKRTEEQRKNISEAHLGGTPWNKGLSKYCDMTYDEYLDNPKICIKCLKPIPFNKRYKNRHCSLVCGNLSKQKPKIYKPLNSNQGADGRFKSGATLPKKTRLKISKKLSGVKKVRGSCLFCRKEGAVGLLRRWHMDNCKEFNKC